LRSRGKHTRSFRVVPAPREGAGVTSEREYEVDAWAHEADEGRGDRRNVQGELHTSDEP
jgi:hypothetical protein